MVYKPQNWSTVISEFKYGGRSYSFQGMQRTQSGETILETITNHIQVKKSFWEMSSLEHIRDLKIQGCYVDVGAFIGNHSVFFSEECQSSKVIAFEPTAFSFSVLVRNIQSNCRKKVHAFNMALGSRPELSGMDTQRGRDRLNLGSTRLTGTADTEDTIVQSMDKLFAGLDLDIGFIKIDAEEKELDVLTGSIETLKKYQPVLYLENISNKSLVKALLGDLGYKPGAKFKHDTVWHPVA